MTIDHVQRGRCTNGFEPGGHVGQIDGGAQGGHEGSACKQGNLGGQ